MKTLSVRDVVRTIGTQQDVADRMGVSRQSVKMWCAKNCVPIARIEKLAKMAGVRPEHLNPQIAKLIARK